MRTLLKYSVALAVGASSLPAFARDTNPEGVPVGHRAIGMGGAYTAVAGDGVSLWYNPAGLGALESKGISANVTVYQWRSQKVEPFAHFGAVEATQGLDVEGSGSAESSDFNSVPSSLVFSLPESKTRHGIAGGLFVPDADDYVMKTSRSLRVNDATVAELKARDILHERSYWVGAGYGYDAGTWAIGASGFAVAHLFQRSIVASVYVNVPEQHLSVVETAEFETTDIQAVLKVGGLYRVSRGLTLGASLRSPSLARLYTAGESLVIHAAESVEGGTRTGAIVDRLETDELKADHRLPLRLDVGLAWQASPRFLLTADLHVTGPLDGVRVLKAPLLCPPDANGRERTCNRNDERTVDLSRQRDRSVVYNAAVGAEIGVTEKVLLRLGAYTDFSAVDDLDADEPLEARVDLFSGSVGFGYLGERGSTDIGLLFRRGVGETRSPFNDSGKAPEVTVTAVGLYLAGSADI
jgi:long-chain fatty acid transport protein